VSTPVRYDDVLADNEPFHSTPEAPTMTKSVTTCDACAAEIETATGRVRLAVEGGAVPASWPVDAATGRPVLDLCRDCTTRLDRWLSAGAEGDRFTLEEAATRRA
jgi:hypothetical protein